MRTQGERNQKAAAPPSSRDTRQPSHNCLHSVPHSGQSCPPEPGSPLLPEQGSRCPGSPVPDAAGVSCTAKPKESFGSVWLSPSIPLPTAVTQSGSENCEESHRKCETEGKTLSVTSSALNGRWAGVGGAGGENLKSVNNGPLVDLGLIQTSVSSSIIKETPLSSPRKCFPLKSCCYSSAQSISELQSPNRVPVFRARAKTS